MKLRLRTVIEADDTFRWKINIARDKIMLSSNSGRVLRCDAKLLSENGALGFCSAIFAIRLRIAQDFDPSKLGQQKEYVRDALGLSKDRTHIC